jgi:adenylylsulfate kinase-like enzyme
LLRLLSEANAQARDWLTAMQLSGEATSADQVDFHAEETGLALFLLDESNIRQLLQVLNLMVHSARPDLPNQNGAEPA